MKSKFTILTMVSFAILIAGCSKNEFNEQDAINAQKELLNLKYQHELDLETLKQKGVNALQQLVNAAALAQLKLSDSLRTNSDIAAKKQDYTVTVVDVLTNSPIADADVTISSQGKLYTAKTNVQGSVTFTSLYLFPTSPFLISKTGYAATQILQQNIAYGTIKLWNTSDVTSEISGNLYIETDLTNNTSEKVGANVLVTASTSIPNGQNNQYNQPGYYNVYFPTYSKADGSYSIKVPAAANSYYLSFEQITADQKLFVNATDDDAVQSFPGSLPRMTTIKTYFNVNSYNAGIPNVTNYFYFKFAPDKNGKALYIPGNQYNYGYNQVFLSTIGDKFQIDRLNVNNYYNNNFDVSNFTYDPNTKVDVEMIDVAGNIIQTAPKLAGLASSNGKLSNYYSPENGNGYVHLKRDDAGVIVPNAKGVILKATSYDNYNNIYNLNFTNNLNSANNRSTGTNIQLTNKGDKRVVNFYYGSGDSRVKQAY